MIQVRSSMGYWHDATYDYARAYMSRLISEAPAIPTGDHAKAAEVIDGKRLRGVTLHELMGWDE